MKCGRYGTDASKRPRRGRLSVCAPVCVSACASSVGVSVIGCVASSPALLHAVWREGNIGRPSKCTTSKYVRKVVRTYLANTASDILQQ